MMVDGEGVSEEEGTGEGVSMKRVLKDKGVK